MIAKPELSRLVRFGIVGIINTLVSITTIYFMMYLDVDYRISNFTGYIVGLVNSFIWSKLWVFKSKEKKIYREIIFFILMFIISYLIQYAILFFLVNTLEINVYISQGMAMITYTLFNYLLNKMITFKSTS